MKLFRRERDIVVDTSIARRLMRGGRIRPARLPGAPKRSRNAQTGIRRVGLRTNWRDDFYHTALTVSWPRFLGLAALAYLLANSFFALLYLAQPGAIANARPGSFLDAFFFSVQTFGTIGYGVLAPATVYANFLMTAETLFGIIFVALATGLIFARVSRPTARVLFAKVLVVAPQDGVPTLIGRMGNERLSQIVQAEVTATLVRNERTSEGAFMRRFYDLKLARSRTPIFAMSYQFMHPVDEMSPLYGCTAEDLDAVEAEILVTVTGLDERIAQTVHARVSYLPTEVLFGYRYADIFGFTQEGDWAIDYRKFHAVEPTAPEVNSEPPVEDMAAVTVQG
jgi:inward rectifier potassium channel